MSDVAIRLARPSDAEALTSLALRAKASWGYDEEFMELCREELTLTPEKMNAWTIWVAECDGRLAGMIALNVGGEQAELEDFMVEPEFHGRGIGRALMSALFKECSTQRVRSVSLDADPNAEAIYRKFGFTRIGYYGDTLVITLLTAVSLPLGRDGRGLRLCYYGDTPVITLLTAVSLPPSITVAYYV